MSDADYVTQLVTEPSQVPAAAWDQLLAIQARPTPFMQHAYLAALHKSGCATAETGWAPHFFLLRQHGQLQAACVVYIKSHSYGEYVFDWSWARAYQEHGLRYYPKAVIAVPFTPVPGSRLLARDAAARRQLLAAVQQWYARQQLSSLHLLFGEAQDLDCSLSLGSLERQTLQFHWHNHGTLPYANFDAFLAQLTQDKRKKIRQERRKVAAAGVRFRWARGADITDGDWDFFYRCYARTYHEHGNPPYLNRAFFSRLQSTMPDPWLLFIAEREGRAIASSLVALHAGEQVAYGRYWGALERVDCLHFEACYYQPLEWCIAHGYRRFEGGAQGEHKMARALMPVATHSAHWLAHPDFSDAVGRFLQQETLGQQGYLEELTRHTPFRAPAADDPSVA